MNSNFDNNEFNGIQMSREEIKSHKNIFSRIFFAFLAYVLLSQTIGIAASLFLEKYAPDMLEDYNVSMIISTVAQYVIAFPALFFALRQLPKQAPNVNKLSKKEFFKLGAVAMFIMYLGNYISQLIIINMATILGFAGENPVNTILSSTSIILSIIIVGIIGPIFEEIMFRKLVIDRLTPYGELVSILIPSLIFGLLHVNIYQFFYAFLLGVAFSFIYVKTGKIIYSTILHIFINIVCGILPSVILGMFDYEEFLNLSLEGALTEEYIMQNILPISLLGIYEIFNLIFVGVGLFIFMRNFRRIIIRKGNIEFPRGKTAEITLMNLGAVTLITICLLLMALNFTA